MIIIRMELNLIKRKLTELPPLNEGLERLYCDKNKLTSLPTLPQSLKMLTCSNNKITTLPDLPESLETLACNENQLKALPKLPAKLKVLYCTHNVITDLPELPNAIEYMNCAFNKLKGLPPLPDSLLKIDCPSNYLISLPELPKNLSYLNCDENDLTSLPKFPNTLEYLYCGVNQLKELPDILNVTELHCGNNELTALPVLSKNINTLTCGYNKLTALPELPNVTELACYHNNIIELPELPKILDLRCQNNKLTTLPELPSNLKVLQCHNNPFEEPYKTFADEYTKVFKDKNSSPSDIKAALKILIKQIRNHKNPPKPWKGFTKSDISKFDIVFQKEASEYALCPVCIRYVERSEACMYMSHNCSNMPGFYHEELYNKFKNDEGNIAWCTICGRICKGHRHYELGTFKTQDKLEHTEDPFEKDCRVSNGGGGLPEKLARFRRFREYALELQDDIGKKTEEEALQELTEEVWNAPIRREKKLLNKIHANKKWNVDMKNFPNNVVNNTNENAPNIPFKGKLPTMLHKGTNNIMGDEDIPVLQFHHTQKDGTVDNHSVAQETLKDFIEGAAKNFGEESFGFCFMYPVCKSRIYPEEIHNHVPDNLYKDYKKKFNKKFKGMTGGGNMFIEADDAICVRIRKTLKRNSRRLNKTRKN